MANWRAGGAVLARVAGLTTRRARWTVAAWLVAAGALNVFVPQLEQVVANDATPFVPSYAPSIQAFERMDKAFGTGDARAMAFVVLVDRDGLTAADKQWYGALADRLRAGGRHVADVQDFVSKPQLEPALTSKDGKAAYLPVGIRHPVGSPEADRDVAWMRAVAAKDRPATLRTFVTGDPASVADLDTTAQHSIAKITLVTVAILLVILLLLYRTWVTPLVAMTTIGVSLMSARGLVALLGQSVLPVSTYTGTFVTALVLGAGTDYAVFLVSRFHEALRRGKEPRDAVIEATRRIGTVIAASGATVIIGSACMRAAHLALFSTTGPAIAVSVFVTLVVSLTLTPALLAIAGHRAGPRSGSDPPQTRWASVGALVARRPAQLVLACLVLLVSLAMLYPTMRPTYDTRALVPAASESDRGFQALDRHFPHGELRPGYLLVVAGHDLRNPRDLATLDTAAQSLTKLPDVTAVRSVTRPEGRAIPQAQLPWQVGQVGERLDQAGTALQRGNGQVDRLASGAAQLSGGADQLSAGASQATSAVDQFLGGLAQEAQGLDVAVAGAGRAGTGAAALRDGAAALADGLLQARDQTATAVDYLGRIYTALQGDAICSTDPICRTSRDGIGQIHAAERDQLVPGLTRAAAAARAISKGDGDLAAGLATLRDGLRQARAGIDTLSEGERTFRSKLGELSGGAAKLADGAGLIPAGVGQLKDATAKLERGLDEAAGFLTGTAKQADAAGVNAFWLPPGAIDAPAFALARDFYISRDGRTARLLVFDGDRATNPAAAAGAVRHALRHTPLAGAAVYATGPVAVEQDLAGLTHADFRLVATVSLIAVFLILVWLLRSLVAPVYLLGSVVLSYLAAMGLTTLFWQHLLGRPMDFTVPLIAFVVLVAVGADYNILLMSRVREESKTATRRGVTKAVTATGGVITSAGLIFAGTFAAMTTSPVLGLAEIGFSVGVGLMLDTFVVRSLLVPSIAALLGRYNWWPAMRRRPGAVSDVLRGVRRATTDRLLPTRNAS